MGAIYDWNKAGSLENRRESVIVNPGGDAEALFCDHSATTSVEIEKHVLLALLDFFDDPEHRIRFGLPPRLEITKGPDFPDDEEPEPDYAESVIEREEETPSEED